MEIRALLFDVNGTLIDIETDEWMDEAYRAVAQSFRHRVEPVRMPRHQQQQRSRLFRAQQPVRREHLLLFARVRAAGNPYRPAAAQRGAQRAGPRHDNFAHLHVELDIADDLDSGARRRVHAQWLRQLW